MLSLAVFWSLVFGILLSLLPVFWHIFLLCLCVFFSCTLHLRLFAGSQSFTHCWVCSPRCLPCCTSAWRSAWNEKHLYWCKCCAKCGFTCSLLLCMGIFQQKMHSVRKCNDVNIAMFWLHSVRSKSRQLLG